MTGADSETSVFRDNFLSATPPPPPQFRQRSSKKRRRKGSFLRSILKWPGRSADDDAGDSFEDEDAIAVDGCEICDGENGDFEDDGENRRESYALDEVNAIRAVPLAHNVNHHKRVSL